MPQKIYDDLEPGAVGVESDLKAGAGTVDAAALDADTTTKRNAFKTALDVTESPLPDTSSFTSADSGRWPAYDHGRQSPEWATFAESDTIQADTFDESLDRQSFSVKDDSIDASKIDGGDASAIRTKIGATDTNTHDRLTPVPDNLSGIAVGTYESHNGELEVYVDDQDASNILHGVAGQFDPNYRGVSQNVTGRTDTGTIADSGIIMRFIWHTGGVGSPTTIADIPRTAFLSSTASAYLHCRYSDDNGYVVDLSLGRNASADTTTTFAYQAQTGTRVAGTSVGTRFQVQFYRSSTAIFTDMTALEIHQSDRWESYRDRIIPKGTVPFTQADETKLDGIETGATADQTAAEIRTLLTLTAQQINDLFVGASISGQRITFTQKDGSTVPIDVPGGGGDGGGLAAVTSTDYLDGQGTTTSPLDLSDEVKDVVDSFSGDGWTNTSGDTTMVAAVSRPQAVRRTASNVASVPGGYGFSQGTGGSVLTSNYIYLRVPVAQSDLSLNAHRVIIEPDDDIGDATAATRFHTTAIYHYYEFQSASIPASSTLRAQTFSKLSQDASRFDWAIVGEPDQDDEVLVADRSTRTRRWQRLDETGGAVMVSAATYPAFTTDVQLPIGDAADSYGAWTEIYRYTASRAESWTFNMMVSCQAGWAPSGGGDRASANIRLRHMNSANVEQRVIVKPLEPYQRHGPSPYAETTKYGAVSLPVEIDMASGDYILVDGQGGSQQGGTAITGRGTAGDIIAVLVDAAHTSINMREWSAVPVSSSLIQEQAGIERIASQRRFANQAALDAATILDGQFAWIPA